MTLRAVYFDLDGTLLDTAPDLANALNLLLESKNKPSLPVETITQVVSDGANAMLTLAFDITPDKKEFAELRERLLEFYLQDIAKHTLPYPGIPELITAITDRGLIWGIATNKPWAYTEPLMEKINFSSKPISVICPDHVVNKKPAPDSLLLACKHANCTPDELIYIGDHKRDIECGQSAEVKTIAAGYGYIPNTENYQNWGADFCVSRAQEIWSILKRLTQ